MCPSYYGISDMLGCTCARILPSEIRLLPTSHHSNWHDEALTLLLRDGSGSMAMEEWQSVPCSVAIKRPDHLRPTHQWHPTVVPSLPPSTIRYPPFRHQTMNQKLFFYRTDRSACVEKCANETFASSRTRPSQA